MEKKLLKMFSINFNKLEVFAELFSKSGPPEGIQINALLV